VATGNPVQANSAIPNQASDAWWNNEVYQPLRDAYSASTVYVPTWSTGGTQPVRGNGTIDGRYKLHAGYGKECLFKFRVTFGTTTTYGTGSWNISLPFASSAFGEQVGILRYNNGSGNYMTGQVVVGPSTSACSLWVPSSSTSTYLVAITSAAPTPTPAATGWFTGEIAFETA
jgi:hypothetical protein